MLFSELYKIFVKKVTFVGFRGGDRPNRPPPGFICKKAKAFPIGLAKVPTLDRIAVGRNLESWWRYEGGPML